MWVNYTAARVVSGPGWSDYMLRRYRKFSLIRAKLLIVILYFSVPR